MENSICEIYVLERIEKLENIIYKYAKACKMLIDVGVKDFLICNENQSTSICKEILYQYKLNYPQIKIKITDKSYNPQNIRGYIILFNYESEVVLYNKDLMIKVISQNFNNTNFISGDFSNVELMS